MIPVAFGHEIRKRKQYGRKNGSARADAMTRVVGKVVSVHAGGNDDLSKPARPVIQMQLDGVDGDRHRSYQRTTWPGDKQQPGTVRRNERQWSAVSVEELAEIQVELGLTAALNAADLGANLCLSGIHQLSRLPKGTLLRFPSGAELTVEEYNPPCRDMGEMLAEKYRTHAGAPLSATAFCNAGKLKRGIVGVVEVAGPVSMGDNVVVEIYQTPSWLERTPV